MYVSHGTFDVIRISGVSCRSSVNSRSSPDLMRKKLFVGFDRTLDAAYRRHCYLIVRFLSFMTSSPPNNDSNSTPPKSPNNQLAEDIVNNNDAASGVADSAMLLVTMEGTTGGTRLGQSASAAAAPLPAQFRATDRAFLSSPASLLLRDRHHVARHEPAEQKNDGSRSPSLAVVVSQLAPSSTADAATEQVHIGQLPQSSSVPPSESTTQTQHAPLPLSHEQVRASIDAAVASLSSTLNQKQAAGSNELENDTLQEDQNDRCTDITMSIGKLTPAKKAKTPRKRPPQVKAGQAAGRWTHDEHQAFLEGLRTCGREWKKVASLIPTRTSAQIRSHAQKYFAKVQREEESTLRDGHSTCGGASAIPSDASLSQMSTSVQQNVERIIANPEAAQREVEETLQALRERYHQLQQRLEQQQEQRHSNRRSRGRLVEDADDGIGSPNDGAMRRRKRTLSDVDGGILHANGSEDFIDDHSSMSSAVSAPLPPRNLECGELIALHVLGGALPRGDSSVDTGAAQEAPTEGSEEQQHPQPEGNIGADARSAEDVDMENVEDHPDHPSSASNGSSAVSEESSSSHPKPDSRET